MTDVRLVTECTSSSHYVQRTRSLCNQNALNVQAIIFCGNHGNVSRSSVTQRKLYVSITGITNTSKSELEIAVTIFTFL